MLLLYFAVLGFIGVVQADLLCYHKKIMSCQITTKDLCPKVNRSTSCISLKAKECCLENDEDVKNTVSFLKEMCVVGSDHNTKYKQHMDCINLATSSPECTSELTKAVENLRRSISNSDDIFEESFKLGCRFGDEIYSCNEENIKRKCGLDALSWYKQLQNAGGNQLNERLCAELNDNGNNSTDVNLIRCMIRYTVLVMNAFF